MFGKLVNRIIRVVFLAGIFLSFTGMQFTWRIYAKEIVDPAKPTFCFDEEGTCTGKGRKLSSITFEEWNEYGNVKQPEIWILTYKPENTSGSDEVAQLTYGVIPINYEEVYPQKKLKLNTYYSINLQNFFKIYQEKGKYKIETFNPMLDKGSFEKAFPKSRE